MNFDVGATISVSEKLAQKTSTCLLQSIVYLYKKNEIFFSSLKSVKKIKWVLCEFHCDFFREKRRKKSIA